MSFKLVSSQVNFSEIDQELINFWKENKVFEKSIEKNPEDNKWNFLDGPPFVTGSPHYGSLLSSIPKDVFGRFWTMKGFRVRRVWGWDGHGLPIENKVENKLKVKRKKDIEEIVGVKKFIEECYKYVDQVSADWEWYVDHIGRWVDFKNAYKTWDLPYMESVMWVFKQMYDKGYIYKGLRVSLFCPHCSTPISNFEVAMDADNYKDVAEPTAVFKYRVKKQETRNKIQENTYFLAWSTTPWNKIVTPALAVNPELDYVLVSQGDEKYILAKSTLKMLKEGPKYKILEEYKGKDLVGWEFELHYDFYIKDKKEDEKAGVIVADEFVTADEGTGIVTLAVYGAEDLMVMNRDKIQKVAHVDEEGMINDSVPLFGGMYYLDSNAKVLEDLGNRGLIYRVDEYTHSVPHCWRCATRLYYSPIDAWFVNIADLKSRLFKNNEEVNWFPKHFKNGRFAKSMEAAPDWNISRNRYWGSPVPVWECSCGERVVPGSIKELEELSGREIKDLHKPEIDEVTIKCPKDDKEMRRVPEVLDSWIEAGSASFAERHFPFSDDKLEDFFPPDFIVEYTGQIRAWFYVLHVIATAIYDSSAFKNVLVTGVILGTDGRKMSKNYGNFPDPKMVMEKYGGDALRLYLMGSPVMHGEDVNFSNDGVPEVTRGFLLILWNCYKYFIDYANIFGWSCEKYESEAQGDNLKVLDKWILARLTQMVLELNKAYEAYDTVTAAKLIREFTVDDFSTWYIRRNRDRVNGENETERNTALSVMYGVLVVLSKVMAPLAPFISDEMFRNLTGGESVHLENFPKGDKSLLDKELISYMKRVREVVEMGHSKRKENSIKLRQPLAKVIYKGEDKLPEELEAIIKEELNVKSVEYKKGAQSIELDTNITGELAKEGEAREIIRNVQKLRKEQGLTLNDLINLTLPEWPEEFKDLILKSTHSVSMTEGSEIKVEVISNQPN
ncbi:MAG TPA: isoleucine--tRNA ligase [Patescibacteria group bacterium]|nr:isoleucine--tRNA ligase [Patescibacteria group bacterium]